MSSLLYFIRTVGKRDLSAVQAVLKQAWQDTYTPLYGAEETRVLSDQWHTIQALEAQLKQPNAEFIIADNGIEIGGMAYASQAADKIVHLHQLYVAKHAQGQGLGGDLLTEIEESFFDAPKFSLEVAPENEAAIAFYHAKGFEKSGTTKDCGKKGSGVPALILTKTR